MAERSFARLGGSIGVAIACPRQLYRAAFHGVAPVKKRKGPGQLRPGPLRPEGEGGGATRTQAIVSQDGGLRL